MTFSLEPTIWQEEEWPEEGMYVLLGKLRQKRAVWRAKTVRRANRKEQKMREIKLQLQGLNKLMAQPPTEVPELVQRYLNANVKGRQAEGKHFRIVIEEKSNLNDGAGIAMLNELRVEKRDGELWSKVYSTGMMQYRGAYANEIDNGDISLSDPMIFEESEGVVVYAIRTSDGNVKVYRFSINHPEEEVCFNIRNFEQTQECIELLRKVITDYEAFGKYVSKSQGNRWYASSRVDVHGGGCAIFDRNGNTPEYNKVAETADIVVILAEHYDRKYDAVVDYYKMHFWVKGCGISSTQPFLTRNIHPGGNTYRIGVSFKATLVNRGRCFADFEIVVGNIKHGGWKNTHNFRVEWPMPEPT